MQRTLRSNRFSCSVGLTGLTILSVSLLTAAGELQWKSQPRPTASAPPPIALLSANATNSTITAAHKASASTRTNDPIFKPFVYVELPTPTGMELAAGPGLHINNDGTVVGTFQDASDDYWGYIWFDDEHLLGWRGPLLDSSSNAIELHSAGIMGINDALEMCGTLDPTDPQVFYYALTDQSVLEGNVSEEGDGFSYAINQEGVIVGEDGTPNPTAFLSGGVPHTLPALPSGNATAAWGVESDSTMLNSIIVGQSNAGLSATLQAVAWHYENSQWNVTALTNVPSGDEGIAVDVSAGRVIAGATLDNGSVDDSVMWYADSGWNAVSLNVATPFIPAAINDQLHPEIVGEEFLWIGEAHNVADGEQFDVVDFAIGMPASNEILQIHLTDINDDCEIVGVLQLDNENDDWVAFKLVPYDVNNNGEADVREIVLGAQDDDNENWLIDWAESIQSTTPTGMRVGLHAPLGPGGPDGEIDPVQIVRMKLNIAPRLGLRPESMSSEEFIDEMVITGTLECSQCEGFTDKVNNWGRGVGRGGEQSEILVRVHSIMGDDASFGDNEALPADQQARDEALEDISVFAYRFSHCVDYLQWGNESLSGSSGYRFRNDELETSGCTWTGGPKTFKEVGELSSGTDCQEEALGLVMQWQEEMMYAALRGSALAGRPMRMVTTGITAGNVRSGYEAGNASVPEEHENYIGFYIVDQMTQWANANQMYFSMHLHYRTVAEAIEAIEKLVDTHVGDGSPWDLPNWRMSTEVGTRADYPDPGAEPPYIGDLWWSEEPGTQGITNRNIHDMFFVGTTDPPEKWEDFIDRWEGESSHWDPIGGSAGFRVGDVMDEFAGAKFAAICWTAGQFGAVPSGPYLVEGLRGTQVRDADFFESGNGFKRFTPLKDAYESGGAAYYLSPSVFEPHPSPCSTAKTCPQCP